MQLLKLAALDGEDLQILSAHLQDAVMRVGDITYAPDQKRFALLLNRFDWKGAEQAKGVDRKRFERRRTVLRFDRVLASQVQGIRQQKKDAVLNLLAVQFDETDAPEGYVTLHFAGGGAIRLHVECIEAELKDLGPVWRATRKPEHNEDDAG